MTWLDGITDLMDMNLSKLQEMGKDREAWHAAVHVVAKSQTGQKSKSSPAPLCKCISSSGLSLYGSTLTSIHDYWKNHSFDYMDLCRQNDISVFFTFCLGLSFTTNCGCKGHRGKSFSGGIL